jgi:hypothetical protein
LPRLLGTLNRQFRQTYNMRVKMDILSLIIQ